jgi:hypothetical protein
VENSNFFTTDIFLYVFVSSENNNNFQKARAKLDFSDQFYIRHIVAVLVHYLNGKTETDLLLTVSGYGT